LKSFALEANLAEIIPEVEIAFVFGAADALDVIEKGFLDWAVLGSRVFRFNAVLSGGYLVVG